MTLPDFIALWQAQPFRAFRLHTARGVFEINYPLGVALSPAMRVVAIAHDTRAEDFALEEIERSEVFGQPIPLAEAVSAIAPETLARHAGILAAAQPAAALPPAGKSNAAFDPGTATFLGTHARNGVLVVQVTVNDRDGRPIFSTAGTNWNVHGTEAFENGTSLYLHHRDHPTVEQRVILWPPDTGTFESYAEAKSLAALTKELKKRDARLAAKPARPEEPTAAWLRKIVPIYRTIEPDGRAAAFGAEPEEDDFDRYELLLVPHAITAKRTVNNPCLLDVAEEDVLFSLKDTVWDATFTRDERTIALSLRHAGREKHPLGVTLDPRRLTARVEDDETDLPLGFVERHLRNFALYEPWDRMVAALRAGPVPPKQPDVVLPLAAGFSAELWAGETRFPLPFLQPHLVDPTGRTLLDLRATTWAASIKANPKNPRVTLSFVSSEADNRYADPRFDLQLDLVTHRVTCRGSQGLTTLGMIQSLVRHVRGMTWLAESLPTWFDKGRHLPVA